MYDDLDRPPLNVIALRRALVVDGGLWSQVRVVASTGSTNRDVAALARHGAPGGLVLIAEAQTSGRGRRNRDWVAPARSGLTFSVLLRPVEAPVKRWGWVPLLAGLATALAVRHLTGLDAVVKWPNDVLVDGRKLAGVLAERVEDAVVVGVGLNVSMRAAELPTPEATSLHLAGANVDRDPMLRAVLRRLAVTYLAWRDAAGDPDASGLRRDYRAHCATLGRPVGVELPGGRWLEGPAEDVDAEGRLVVGGTLVSAGDVVHVR